MIAKSVFLSDYLKTRSAQPNRGPRRHFWRCYSSGLASTRNSFFDTDVLTIMRSAVDETVVADQWGYDVLLPGFTRAHGPIEIAPGTRTPKSSSVKKSRMTYSSSSDLFVILGTLRHTEHDQYSQIPRNNPLRPALVCR